MKQAQDWCADGRAIEVSWEGTHAVMVTAEHEEYLRSAKLPVGQRYSHQHETPFNPRGVWTLTRQYA